MNYLNGRIAALRKTRVCIRRNIEAAGLIGDRCDRDQRIHDLTLTLRSTEPEWRDLQRQKDARDAGIELAQLRHARTRPAAAPVRRSAASIGYSTKVLVPR